MLMQSISGEIAQAKAERQGETLACDLIIITTPYMPVEFYNALFPAKMMNHNHIDSLDQLVRRISVTIEMTGKKIQAMRFGLFPHNPMEGYYWPIPGTERLNPYSCLARPTPPDSDIDFFNSMFDD